jgi:hypothetical protein
LNWAWGWVVSLTLQPLNPREGAAGRYWIRDEMNPITGVEAMEMGILTLPIFEPAELSRLQKIGRGTLITTDIFKRVGGKPRSVELTCM